jgi:hypothetical protein
MSKGSLAVIIVCAVVIVGMAIWIYSLAHSIGAGLATLTILVPFILFGIGMSKATGPRQPDHDDF